MKIKTKADDTTRVITLGVEGAEPMMNQFQPHRSRKVSFRPDTITVKIHRGELASVYVSGGLVLKSGETSTKARDDNGWHGARSFHEEAPEWLLQVVTEAIYGVTEWTR